MTTCSLTMMEAKRVASKASLKYICKNMPNHTYHYPNQKAKMEMLLAL